MDRERLVHLKNFNLVQVCLQESVKILRKGWYEYFVKEKLEFKFHYDVSAQLWVRNA